MSISDPRDDHDSSSLSDIEKGDALKEKDEIALESLAPTHQFSLETAIAQEEKDVQSPPTSSLTDWNGPNDPDNPHNWPMWMRVYHATTPGLFGFAVSVYQIS